eukprot:gene16942-biopygen9824
MSEGPRRSSDRYPGGPGRCQKGSAVAVTDIQGPQGDVRHTCQRCAKRGNSMEFRGIVIFENPTKFRGIPRNFMGNWWKSHEIWWETGGGFWWKAPSGNFVGKWRNFVGKFVEIPRKIVGNRGTISWEATSGKFVENGMYGQKGPAVAVTDIRGSRTMSAAPPGSDRYPGDPGRCQRRHRRIPCMPFALARARHRLPIQQAQERACGLPPVGFAAGQGESE